MKQNTILYIHYSIFCINRKSLKKIFF